MARKVQRKGRIQEGFPKLAFWLGPSFRISFPATAKAWNYTRRVLTTDELVVIVAQKNTTSYYDLVTGQYEFIRDWRNTDKRITFNHIIPVGAIGKGEIPITCIYNWTQSYKSLPHFLTKYTKIIESNNGKESITAAA